MKNTMPTTQNAAWGFFGTIAEYADATTAWAVAMKEIAKATTMEYEAVRAFLDSKHGRHFADDVLNGVRAGHTMTESIANAIKSWMGWRIGRKTAKHYGIPEGMPYLTGFVALCEIEQE